jgi:hypothetical protein
MKSGQKEKTVAEDAPANAAGGGNVAGIGVGPQGEPPGPKNILARLRRKKPVEVAEQIVEVTNQDYFAGNPVFKVSDDFYHKCHMGKKKYHRYEKYVGGDHMGEAIRQYGLKNHGKPIVIQNEKTGAMLYLRYGKKEK